MLERVGGHYVVTGDDEAEVERVLQDLLHSVQRADSPSGDETILKEWTTEVQMKRLLEAVYG